MSSDGACFGQTTQLGISPCFEQFEIGISDGMYVFLVEIRDQIEIESKDVIPIDFSTDIAVQSCLRRLPFFANRLKVEMPVRFEGVSDEEIKV